MSEPIRVIVMAVGSPLGQSIMKALLASGLPVSLFLTDIGSLAAGFYLEKKAVSLILPPVKSPEYASALKEQLEAHAIQVVFPVIAQEHAFFGQHPELSASLSLHVVSSPPETFELCSDKYRSMLHLRSRGLAVPDTSLAEEDGMVNDFLSKNPFPVLVKPRFGASSMDVFLVRDARQLGALRQAFARDYLILQEYLPGTEEYTVGVYISRDRAVKRTFTIRRELKFGLSYKGEIIDDPLIGGYALRVCSALGTTYSANVQVRLKDGRPFVFEINPRLSSTTSVRAHFGFNEPEMILRELYPHLGAYSRESRKGKFMRYWEEIYLEGE